MKKVKSFLKYAIIGILAVVIIIGVSLIYFIFKNEAPIISGNIEYGINYKNDLKLDIYAPTKNVFKTSPIVFYVHGGAWIGGSKIAINFDRFNGAVNTLREKGYTIICPNYTLAKKGKSPFPDCILDIYEAIDWTKKHSQHYNLDTTNMGLLGESAGAHIAMMIAFHAAPLKSEYKNSKFNYLIDVYGPNDLEGIYHSQLIDKLDASLNKLPEILRANFDMKQYVFGFDPNKDSIKAREMLSNYSPINFLAKKNFPTLIIHGKKDQIVPVEQSTTLKSKMDKLGMISEIHLLDSVDHAFRKANQAQMDSTQIWISDFVLRCYKNNI